jgi:hypothetical protein
LAAAGALLGLLLPGEDVIQILANPWPPTAEWCRSAHHHPAGDCGRAARGLSRACDRVVWPERGRGFCNGADWSTDPARALSTARRQTRVGLPRTYMQAIRVCVGHRGTAAERPRVPDLGPSRCRAVSKTCRRETAAHGVVADFANGQGRGTDKGQIEPGGFAPRVKLAAQAWVVLPTLRRTGVDAGQGAAGAPRPSLPRCTLGVPASRSEGLVCGSRWQASPSTHW